MKIESLKWILRKTIFQSGTVVPILFGPLQGSQYKISENTGLSPLYSGTERDVQRTLRGLVKNGDVAIDIGANWGIHTIYLSKLAGQNGHVLALEPFPAAYQELIWHLSQNNCHNVKALPLAIGNENKLVDFVVGLHATTGHLLERHTRTTYSEKTLIAVDCKTLDALVEELNLQKIKLVKIDAEGNEGNILTGALKTVARFRPYFLIELHTPEQDVFVANWLAKQGYTLRRLSHPPILRTDVGWPEPSGVWGTILAAPHAEGI